MLELEAETLSDPQILDLARKVVCEVDPDTLFPKYFSGGLIVTTKDGREFIHHEPVNRGSGDRALSEDEISAKFFENAELVVSHSRANRIRDYVLDLDRKSARKLTAVLRV